jgi:hypothetical protein
MNSIIYPRAVRLLAVVCLLHMGLPASVCAADEVKMKSLGTAHQFVFFAVLEGLYRDGVGQDDVEAMLRRASPNACYDHFIYACPICTAAVQALELYRNRPQQLYSLKLPCDTFGAGLDAKISQALRAADAKTRLTTIHNLLSRWIGVRLGMVRGEEKDRLLAELKAGREEGMTYLKKWQSSPEDLARYAPAYAGIGECAACNAAAQMRFTPEK